MLPWACRVPLERFPVQLLRTAKTWTNGVLTVEPSRDACAGFQTGVVMYAHTFELGTLVRISFWAARLRQRVADEVSLPPTHQTADMGPRVGHATAVYAAGVARGLLAAVCMHHIGHVLSGRQMPAQASADGAVWTHVYLGPSPVRAGDPNPDRCRGWKEGSKQRRTLLTWHAQAQALARRMTQAHPEPASSPVSGRSVACARNTPC